MLQKLETKIHQSNAIPRVLRSSPYCWFIVAFVAGAILTGAAGSAAPATPAPVSDSARAQIQALLQEKSSWTPAQRKLESHLIHALKQSRGQSFAPEARNLELDVKIQTDGRVLVDINANVTPELLALVRQRGGEVINSFPQFRAVRALIPVAQLETLASSGDVASIRRADEAYHNIGTVNSEGDTTHGAVIARNAFGATGAGVKVGVLSGGVEFLTTSQASGDLGPVTILSGQTGDTTDAEGTAMLEIIHDLAPGAQLYFATAGSGPASFAQNIIGLYNSGCRVLVDDEGYFSESPFQDDAIAQAVNTVTAGGALYFSAAGNSGNLDSGTSGTWEGDFVDGGAAVFPISEAGRLHSFGAANYDTVVTGGSTRRADLFWSDRLGGAANDYDLFVLDSTGSSVLRSSTSSQSGTQDPYESVSTLNVGERIVIVKFSGAARFLRLTAGRGQLSISTPGATFGHSATTNAFSIAAVDVATAYPNPFSGGSANPVEGFSSDGPRHVFFHATGTDITPGNYSSTGGAFRAKPDLTAGDGISCSVSGFTPFYGTSAAAPHAAAIGALLKSYNPSLTPAQIRAIFLSTAADIMAPGMDRASGAGLIMADRALQAAPPGALLITPGAGFNASGPSGGPFSVTAASLTLTNNGAASINWSLVNTSAWLSVSPTSGTLTSGGVAAVVTVRLNAASSNLASGVYLGSVWFTNVTSGLGQSRQFQLNVTPSLGAPTDFAPSLAGLNPLAYWRLNETNRVAAAAVVGNSGSLGSDSAGFDISGVLQRQPGIVSNCFRFSNPSWIVSFLGSHVDVPYQAALNPNGPFAIELWAKPAQQTIDLFCPACSMDPFQNAGNSRSGWIIYQDTNSWQFRLGGFNGYAVTVSGGAVQANVWQHIVGVYDGTNASLYVNGLLVGGPSLVSGFSPNTSKPLRLGATSIPNRTYDGWVDEPALYGGVLSASQIAAHYAAVTTNNSGYGAQILAAHPLGYWHLEESAYSPSDPVALNIGSLAPMGNGSFQVGALPGVPGVPTTGFDPLNYACQFQSGAYIDVAAPYLNLTGPLTLSAWVKTAQPTGTPQTILSKGSAAYFLAMDIAGLPHFAAGAQLAGDLIGLNRVDDGLWHHWVGVYDGINSEYLYIDGLLAASVNTATAPVTANSNDLLVGADPDAGQYFSGVIDEVAIFTNALTATQIGHLYNLTAPPVFQSIGQTGGTTHLSWSALPNRSYQLQFKTNLNQTTWSNLVTVVPAGAVGTASDSAVAGPHRFYRVVLVP